MFVSLDFILLLLISFLTFFIVPAHYRKYVLLIASYLLCMQLSPYSAIALAITTGFVYIAACYLEGATSKQKSRAKVYYIVSVLILLFSLCIFKYSGDLSAKLLNSEGQPNEILMQIVMPLGFSFYVFQAISYLSDVYRQKMHAEKDFVAVALSLSFFPKLISGPIERNLTLLPQIKDLPNVQLRDAARLETAFCYMLYGYFLKMVLADPMSNPVRIMFENPTEFKSAWMLTGVIMYTLQIYFDFAGYSYIAIGVAKLFGIHLTENFRQPYLANSITDFWRRWHISLSSWLRDYLYIPLGGNRKGKLRKCINTLIVFLVCGMWHGSGFTFIIWGLLHGIYSVIDSFLPKKRRLHILTFCEVAIAWIFFRANTLSGAVQYITCLITNGERESLAGPGMELLGLNIIRISVLAICSLIVFCCEIIAERKKAAFPAVLYQSHPFLRNFMYCVLIIAIWIFGMYGPGYQSEQFIYMQF